MDITPEALRRYADMVELRIVDSGPGVPTDRLNRMFAHFQRLGDRGNSGLGLGLSMVRGFTEAMGGTITAETHRAVGSPS